MSRSTPHALMNLALAPDPTRAATGSRAGAVRPCSLD